MEKTNLIDSFDYRDSSYFNNEDCYEFKNSYGQLYKSKANFDKGYWWLNDYYKATTVVCRVIKRL